jgi:hypothetical protein
MICSLVWFPTFIQNHKILTNQKKSINIHRSNVLNCFCLHIGILGGVLGVHIAFVNGKILVLIICGILFTWLSRPQNKVFLERLIGGGKELMNKEGPSFRVNSFIKCISTITKSRGMSKKMFSYYFFSSFVYTRDSLNWAFIPSNKRRKKS